MALEDAMDDQQMSDPKRQRIDVWRSEVALNTFECTCHRPGTPAASPSMASSSGSSSAETCPACARQAALATGHPLTFPAEAGKPRAKKLWGGIKRLARRCTGRDGYPYEGRNELSAAEKPGGDELPGSDDDEVVRTDMYSPLRTGDSEVFWGRTGDDEAGGASSDEGVAKLMAQREARLARAERLLGRLRQQDGAAVA